jgi:hypothetical protein
MKVSSWYSSWDLICLLTPLPRPPIWLLVWRDPNQYHRKTGQGGRGRVGNGMEGGFELSGGLSFNCKTMFQQAWRDGWWWVSSPCWIWLLPNAYDGRNQSNRRICICRLGRLLSVRNCHWCRRCQSGPLWQIQPRLLSCWEPVWTMQCIRNEDLRIFVGVPTAKPMSSFILPGPQYLGSFFSPNQSSTGKMG